MRQCREAGHWVMLEVTSWPSIVQLHSPISSVSLPAVTISWENTDRPLKNSC